MVSGEPARLLFRWKGPGETAARVFMMAQEKPSASASAGRSTRSPGGRHPDAKTADVRHSDGPALRKRRVPRRDSGQVQGEVQPAELRCDQERLQRAVGQKPRIPGGDRGCGAERRSRIGLLDRSLLERGVVWQGVGYLAHRAVRLEVRGGKAERALREVRDQRLAPRVRSALKRRRS